MAVSRPGVQRPAAKIDVGSAILRLDEVGVAGSMQFGVRSMSRTENVFVRVQFVWTGNLPRACHRDGVAPARAAFGCDEIIPAAAFVKVRHFREAQRRSLEDIHLLAHKLALIGRILLQDDAGETILSRSMVPEHVQEVLAAVLIVEQ